MTQPERVSDEELDDIVADECSPNQRQMDLLAMECQWSRCRIRELEKLVPYVQHKPGCRRLVMWNQITDTEVCTCGLAELMGGEG